MNRHRRRYGWLCGWLGVAVLGASVAVPAAANETRWPPRVERVTLAPDGSETNGHSNTPSISLDGRFVAYGSRASNLVPDDTNGKVDIFVTEIATGATERVSVGNDGRQSTWGVFHGRTAISGDGRYVAFASFSPDLVESDTNGEGDIFVRDRVAGTTEVVSVASDGTLSNNQSENPAISADGRYVVFESWGTNLVENDTNGDDDDPWLGSDVFRHDRETGETRRVSVSSDGDQADAWSLGSAISTDGNHVAFMSPASNLVAGRQNGVVHVYAHDVESGVTERVSVATDGTPQNNDSSPVTPPSISDGGRYVAFDAVASNLIPFDTNFNNDVFVRDRGAGRTERISVTSVGAQAPPPHGSSFRSQISPDGRFVTFDSGAKLVPPTREREDGTLILDIYRHDRLTGITEIVSVDEDGVQPEESSFEPSFSADGRYIAFEGRGTTLVAGDTNGFSDIFVRDSGPDVGIGDLRGAVEAGGSRVKGWTRFMGTALADAESPSSTPFHDSAGLDITRGRVLYRPELGDLLVRIDLSRMPSVSGVAGTPGVVYGTSFEVDGVRYEARAVKPVEEIATGPPQVDLYRCDPQCSRVGDIESSYGNGGADVRFSLPLEMVGASTGSDVTEMRVFTGFGTRQGGVITPADELVLGDVSIPQATVQLGVVDPAESASFDISVEVEGDTFEVFVEDQGRRSYDVVARGCLGSGCGPTLRIEGARDSTTELRPSAIALEIGGRGNKRALTARLYDPDLAEGIAGRVLEIYGDGDHLGSPTTDSDGIVTFFLPPRFRGGKHLFEARFTGDEVFMPSTEQIAT